MKRFPPLTIALIALCVAVAAISRLGEAPDIVSMLFIADPYSSGLSDIASGQVWRLITPIFLHFGFLHLLFNMMWLWDLGRLIEERKGSAFFAGFILVVGVMSNLTQYVFDGSPTFGGMSGVVYGLLAYIWMQGKYNPRFGFMLHKETVVMMLVWFVLCWTGMLGPIANWAHTAGLVVGCVWGYVARKDRLGQGS